MIKINVVCVGKLKEKYWRDAIAEYTKRLSRFCKLEIRELAEKATPEAETEEILRACRGCVFVLAAEGESCTSEVFAGKLKKVCDKGEEITFVIGSSCGLSARVKVGAREKISFSALTFPHQMMRVILLEQVYRAFMILCGSEYHK